MKIITLVLMFFGSMCYAQDPTGGFQTLLAEKLKEAKPVGILNLNAKPAAAAFLPIWTFEDLSGAEYVEVGGGGKFQQGEKAHAFLGLDFNVVAISSRLWNFPWAQTHVKRSKFPPIFLGPSIELPVDLQAIKDWTIDSNCGIFFSVRFQ